MLSKLHADHVGGRDEGSVFGPDVKTERVIIVSNYLIVLILSNFSDFHCFSLVLVSFNGCV